MSDKGWGDPRLPSGKWNGFYLRSASEIQNRMDLNLDFETNNVTGEGVDAMGAFLVLGAYDPDSGKVWWTKTYVDCDGSDSAHDVSYEGNADHNGIWGTWCLAESKERGGFRIWPRAEDKHVDCFDADRVAEWIDLPLTKSVVGYSTHTPFPEAM